jgi:hypothetical protein
LALSKRERRLIEQRSLFSVALLKPHITVADEQDPHVIETILTTSETDTTLLTVQAAKNSGK